MGLRPSLCSLPGGQMEAGLPASLVPRSPPHHSSAEARPMGSCLLLSQSLDPPSSGLSSQTGSSFSEYYEEQAKFDEEMERRKIRHQLASRTKPAIPLPASKPMSIHQWAQRHRNWRPQEVTVQIFRGREQNTQPLRGLHHQLPMRSPPMFPGLLKKGRKEEKPPVRPLRAAIRWERWEHHLEDWEQRPHQPKPKRRLPSLVPTPFGLRPKQMDLPRAAKEYYEEQAKFEEHLERRKIGHQLPKRRLSATSKMNPAVPPQGSKRARLLEMLRIWPFQRATAASCQPPNPPAEAICQGKPRGIPTMSNPHLTTTVHFGYDLCAAICTCSATRRGFR
ncbi:uncharacterized protein LOC128352250 isoform X2 [Hemicordylus capensis]|nr:uncharacterized protein LOC128352250 isoform X2 [Hemicordylus capensis]